MQELEVQFLGQEDPLEEEMAIHSSVLAWRIPRTERAAWWATVHGVDQLEHTYIHLWTLENGEGKKTNFHLLN